MRRTVIALRTSLQRRGIRRNRSRNTQGADNVELSRSERAYMLVGVTGFELTDASETIFSAPPTLTIVLLHVALLAFDASTFEIWSALLNGGRLEVFPPDLDLRDIETVAERAGVTTMLFSAGLFHALFDACPDACGHERQILAGAT